MKTLSIKNCNNINSGKLNIEENKLNIFFGRNGVGKSTIAKAIEFSSQKKDLSILMPFGNNSLLPEVVGMTGFKKVKIFNEDYVNQYIYQPNSLIPNAFDVFIRTKEYDDAKKEVDIALMRLKSSIRDNEEIRKLSNSINNILNKIKLNKNNSIKKTSGVKGVLEGKGAYFNPPDELKIFEPFFKNESVAQWADWRNKGFNNYGDKGKCPYCGAKDVDETDTINKLFNNTFDKASIETANIIINVLDEQSEYIEKEKITKIKSLFGVSKMEEDFTTIIVQFVTECEYLNRRLSNILSFNEFDANTANVDSLENCLYKMRIEQDCLSSFFCTQKTDNIINSINKEIDELKKDVGKLKGQISICRKRIETQVETKNNDINDFLKIAGFNYTFKLKVIDEKNTAAILEYISPDGITTEVVTPKDHLSWGEKNSFALILFMFDALSNNTDLIILDDPISSFDQDKKYAIINRLFKTGSKNLSFYEKTVMMLTHDFEPLIDYIKTNSGRQSPTSTTANYIDNINGKLSILPINRDDDLMSIIVLMKDMAKNPKNHLAVRIGCLRKYYEHHYKKPKDESVEYNILSSLIHGRQMPSYDSDGENIISQDDIYKGEKSIAEYIPSFIYKDIYEELSPDKLLEAYNTETNDYAKILILRVYVERRNGARDRLRLHNDVLRKYVDESFHIENDYMFSLDFRKFNIVPKKHIEEADRFFEKEKLIK